MVHLHIHYWWNARKRYNDECIYMAESMEKMELNNLHVLLHPWHPLVKHFSLRLKLSFSSRSSLLLALNSSNLSLLSFPMLLSAISCSKSWRQCLIQGCNCYDTIWSIIKGLISHSLHQHGYFCRITFLVSISISSLILAQSSMSSGGYQTLVLFPALIN